MSVSVGQLVTLRLTIFHFVQCMLRRSRETPKWDTPILSLLFQWAVSPYFCEISLTLSY